MLSRPRPPKMASSSFVPFKRSPRRPPVIILSYTFSMTTVELVVAVAISPVASVVVTWAVKESSPKKSTGGVKDKPVRSSAATSQFPLSTSNTPAESSEPSGRPDITTAPMVSEPSVSTRAALKSKAIAVFSSPTTSPELKSAASASAVTAIATSPALTVTSSPSRVEIATPI